MNRIFYIFVVFLFIPLVHAETISNGCDNIRYHELKVVYRINEYTCNVGEFLPANTAGCTTCPSGHVCNGGTFEFNHEKSQGIKYGNFAPNTPKVCSSNMPGMLSAVYEPNKITLNWIDRDTITQTQCTYDTPIAFPSEPVRPGYKFMGWQIKAKE